MSRTVLIVVDVQQDFLPGGALGVPDGNSVVYPISNLAHDADLIVATRDWHPRYHCSFDRLGGPWPVHCVRGTTGAKLHLLVDRIADVIISKGMDPHKESYSGFDNPVLGPMLSHHFTAHDNILITGLATDYCVRATALDAVRYGFQNVIVPTDCVRGVDPSTTSQALAEMKLAGVKIFEDNR